MTPGAELQFTFEGTALDLVVFNADAAGDIDVYLDGRLVRRLTASLAPVNNAPALRVASHLRDARHTVRIVVRSGSFDLDGIVVVPPVQLAARGHPHCRRARCWGRSRPLAAILEQAMSRLCLGGMPWR